MLLSSRENNPRVFFEFSGKEEETHEVEIDRKWIQIFL